MDFFKYTTIFLPGKALPNRGSRFLGRRVVGGADPYKEQRGNLIKAENPRSRKDRGKGIGYFQSISCRGANNLALSSGI